MSERNEFDREQIARQDTSTAIDSTWRDGFSSPPPAGAAQNAQTAGGHGPAADEATPPSQMSREALQRLAASMLAMGCTVTQTAFALDIHRGTLWTWTSQTAFRELMREASKTHVEGVIDATRHLLLRCLTLTENALLSVGDLDDRHKIAARLLSSGRLWKMIQPEKPAAEGGS